MNENEARKLLEQHDQAHVLAFWDRLEASQREALLAQIETIVFEAIQQMQSMLGAQAGATAGAPVEPPEVIELAEVEARDAGQVLTEAGTAAMARGEVGVLLVAGGQGSRLGFEGPKGAFLLGPLSNASLFEIHARKVLALERRHEVQIPFYIMTSQANDAPTKAFFEANDYFGLSPERVLFFTQGMWPALDGDGHILLERPDRIFMSPDGHGGTVTALRDRGMFADMDRRGISTLFYFQVDNPLVEVADPRFIGLHLKEGADVSIKVCAKRDAEEGLGVVAAKNGKHMIVEYSELTPEQMHARRQDGRLKLLFGSVAIHVFSVAFLKQEAAAALPLHTALKKVPVVDEEGHTVTPDTPNAYKFEKFIFDVVPDAGTALNVEFSREDEFSPVKNATGSDSPGTSRRDMIRKAARLLEAAGATVPRDAQGEPWYRLEIDPCFALDADELRDRLGKSFAVEGDLLLVDEEA